VEQEFPVNAASGFHETYRRISVTMEQSTGTTAQTYALAELLIAKGVIGMDELDRARRGVENRLTKAAEDAGMAVQLADEPDKYALPDGDEVRINCAERYELCRAACCKLRFALSEQDIHEGVVRWDLAAPYLNRQREDGSCVHSNAETLHCDVYAHRPGVCRRYDCRQDKRIWLDFDNRQINPELHAG
jgi:Fe-S-cluster containining protein